ncbi:MAG TPA: hypothetical protein VIK81_05080 [Patescibacteria group bacterium]
MKFKILLPVIVVILVLIGGIFFAIRTLGSKSAETVEKELTNIVLPIDQRPYLFLIPSQEGKAVRCTGQALPKDTAIRMQVVYETDNVQQGFFCEIAANLESGSYDREQILGTCSKGVCKYDRNVEFGEVTNEIVSTTNEYETLTQVHFQKANRGALVLISKDKNYTLEIPTGNILKLTNFITMQTSGMPKPYEGNTLIDQPVGFFSDNLQTLQTPAKLTITLDSSPANAKIIGFDPLASEWKEFETTFDSATKQATAEVNLLSSYIVIDKQFQ